LLAALLLPASARADLLLYTPDLNPGNLGVLSAAVSRYLAQCHVDVAFQAFARYEDFIAELRTRRPDFLSAPGWVEAEPASAPLTSLARPLRDGRAFFRKALLVNSEIKRAADLKSASIAMAAHGSSEDILRDVLATLRVEYDSVRVMPVPKDVDALLALGFGQVDAALVSVGQLERLTSVNPHAAQHIQVLALSEEVPFPLIYSTKNANRELVTAMVDGLAGIGNSETGTTVLNLLGYDGLEILTPTAQGSYAP